MSTSPKIANLSDRRTSMERDAKIETAVFAGGCFWCMEEAFQKLPGVKSVISGYTGGQVRSPTYEAVSAGGTGHAEVVEIVFDSAIISYEKLLDLFWLNIDPTTENRQFCDEGNQYRSEIFVLNKDQAKLAEDSKKKITKIIGKVFTKISEAGDFYPAEEYHQDYFIKNPIRYKTYKFSCGRAERLNEIWGSKTKQN